MKRLILLLAMALLMLISTSALSAIPRGFENYESWQRLACLDMTVGDYNFHVHMYDRDSDGFPDAAELYMEPNFIDPAFYMFDINGDKMFSSIETISAAEIYIKREDE